MRWWRSLDRSLNARPWIALLVVGPICGVLIAVTAAVLGIVDVDGVAGYLWAPLVPGILPVGVILAVGAWVRRSWQREVETVQRRGPAEDETSG